MASTKVTMTFTMSDGTTQTQTFTVPNGVNGAKGDPGVKGEPGTKGDPGAAGVGIKTITVSSAQV